jgi:hypothetical protein
VTTRTRRPAPRTGSALDCRDRDQALTRTERATRGVPARYAPTPIAVRATDPGTAVVHGPSCPASTDSADLGHGPCLCGAR